MCWTQDQINEHLAWHMQMQREGKVDSRGFVRTGKKPQAIQAAQMLALHDR